MKKERINEFLRELVKKGELQEFGFDKYGYWNSVPYIKIDNEEIFLCKNVYFNHSLTIKTIYDYKEPKKVIEKIINNKDILKKYYISDYGKLLDYLAY